MSRVFVCGLGAVSPAGWDVPAMRDVLKKGVPLPVQSLERPGWEEPLHVRLVPSPASRPGFLTHPRLRRTSPITHYAASAALEAMAKLPTNASGTRRLGLVMCLQSGCVNYSHRFFQEALKDPTTASPLLFPETVFAAPASHIAALLTNAPLVYTLLGDPSCFLQGMALGIQWLEENRVEACLVIGAEEYDWLLADALWHFERATVISSGAGAVCLSLDPALSLGVELSAITDAHTYSTRKGRTLAARSMRSELPSGSPDQLLCDGMAESRQANAPETSAWRDWTGPRVSPKRLLGEGLMAAAAWQCVAACDGITTGQFSAANVSLVGSNQQAVGARFVRSHSTVFQLFTNEPSSSISP